MLTTQIGTERVSHLSAVRQSVGEFFETLSESKLLDEHRHSKAKILQSSHELHLNLIREGILKIIVGVLILGLHRRGELLWISNHDNQFDGGTIIPPYSLLNLSDHLQVKNCVLPVNRKSNLANISVASIQDPLFESLSIAS